MQCSLAFPQWTKRVAVVALAVSTWAQVYVDCEVPVGQRASAPRNTWRLNASKTKSLRMLSSSCRWMCKWSLHRILFVYCIVCKFRGFGSLFVHLACSGTHGAGSGAFVIFVRLRICRCFRQCCTHHAYFMDLAFAFGTACLSFCISLHLAWCYRTVTARTLTHPFVASTILHFTECIYWLGNIKILKACTVFLPIL